MVNLIHLMSFQYFMLIFSIFSLVLESCFSHAYPPTPKLYVYYLYLLCIFNKRYHGDSVSN